VLVGYLSGYCRVLLDPAPGALNATIDNLSEQARNGLQEKVEQDIWPTKAPRLPQRHRPGWQEGHRGGHRTSRH
jgi:hypothetical protein